MVAALSHHCMRVPAGGCASGYHVVLLPSDTSWMTVSMAHRNALKHRTCPFPQASLLPGGVPASGVPAAEWAAPRARKDPCGVDGGC